MFKPVIAATAVLAIAGSSVVYAQQNSGEQNGIGHWGPRAGRHHHANAADMAAFTDARIAALRAGLELTADQQQNWPPFEQALRGVAQLRAQAAAARHAHGQDNAGAPQQDAQQPQQDAQQQQQNAQQPQGQQQQAQRDPFDRLAQRADTMARMSAALKKVADAGRPLYQSLSDTQKQRFKTLSKMLRPQQRRFAFNERGGGGHHGGHGFGGGERGFGGHHRMGPNGGGGSGSEL